MADRSRGARRPVQLPVVMHDRHTIAREMHIELQAVGAGGEAAVERGDRIFRADLAAATMREDERGRRFERTMHGGILG